MEHVFVDTSFLVARFNRQDRHHAAASRFLRSQRRPGAPALRFFLSDYVFDETVTTLLAKSGRHDVAVAAGRAIRGSQTLPLVRVEEPIFDAAWDLFTSRGGKKWSFTDCTSFVLMDKLDVRRALSFDGNFREAGFVMLP